MPKPGGPEERRRYLPIPHEDLAALCTTSSPLPEHLRENRILEYDTSLYPFREAIADILDTDPDNLETIHETGEGKTALAEEQAGSNKRKRGKQPHFLRIWTSSGQTEARQRFNRILHEFVDKFVSVHMGEEGEVAEVGYQREPTFRVVLPSGEEYGYRHCDADYHHPPAEVNWWLPLTPVSGSNTLHTESRPGMGDFTPVEMRYGEVLRFYGNMCQHYAVPNISGRTRVSFDLRVVALAHHEDTWVDRLGRQSLFQVGAYYTRAGGGGGKEEGERKETLKDESEEDIDNEQILDNGHLFS